MRLRYLLIVLNISLACAPPLHVVDVPSATGPVYVADLPHPIRGLSETSYLTVSGTDTIRLHNIIRVPGHFATDINLPRLGAFLKLTGTVGTDELVKELQIKVWRRDSTGVLKQVQVADYSISGDSVTGEVRDATRRQPQRFAAPKDAMIFGVNLLALTEQIIRRAQFLGADSTAIPLYYYGTAGATGLALVKLDRSRLRGTIDIGGVVQTFEMNVLGVLERHTIGTVETRRIPFREIPTK